MMGACSSTSATWSAGSPSRGSSRRKRSVRVDGASPFSYAVYRLVPRVERGEQMNVGVVVFSRPLRYLAARTALDERRLAALWPELDPESVRPHLAAIERVANGDTDAGPIARLDEGPRFYSLSAPSST